MRGCAAACMFVVCSLIGLRPIGTTAAQAPNPAPLGIAALTVPDSASAVVVVVMESPGGVRAASSLRAALHRQASFRVLSVADVARAGAEPAAVLTISAVAAREVSVAYWDVAGGRDALSAPAPARADQLDAVVLALASALLERHRPELVVAAQPSARESELARTTEELYAALGRYSRALPRTNVALRFEDF